MIIYSVLLTLIQLAIVKSYTSPSLSDISTCESVTTNMHCYGQCLDFNSNCDLCEGTLTSGVCTKPSVTAASCIQPGFMLNTAGDTCIDCRTEETCLLNCMGFWDLNLMTCLKGKQKTFKISKTGTLCGSLAQADCRKCRSQKYEWSTTLLKCVKCPPGNWNATTMKCSALSTTLSTVTGQGLRTDTTYGICYTETTNKYLNLYSNACDACSTDCTSCGAYTNCISCQTNFLASTDVLGVCECKGTNYINAATSTTCSTCTSTIQNCSKCKSDGTCLQCILGYGMDTTLGYCILCAQFNAANPVNCDIPVLKFCSQPSTDGLFCYQCISNDLYFDTQLMYCVCKNSKNLDLTTGLCSLCSDTLPNCATCSNGVCLTCQDPNEYLNSTKTGCVCSGYIVNGQCQQCSLTLANCLSCSSGGSSCTKCMANYGLLAVKNTCYACNTIDINCISCDGASKCLSCTNGFVLDTVANKCVCDTSTQTKAIFNGFCIICSNAINSCNQCAVNSGSLVCTQCSSLYIPLNGICQQCTDGYYKSNNSCLACTVANCKSCTTTDCYTCKNGYSLSNNTCTCVAPMIIDSDSVCKTCITKYGPLCTACSATACTACGGTNYTAGSTGCVCVKGVDNSSAQNCIGCPANCSSCTSDSTFTNISCTQCDSGYKVMANGQCGQCTSPQYYDSSSKSCKTCNANCSACADNAGGGNCSQCSNGYTLNALAACECTNTKVLNGTNCVNCSDQYNAQCSTCDSTKCLTCNANYFINGSYNCIQCPVGQYFLQSSLSCTICSSNCSNCANLTGACTQCSNNYNLNSSNTCECITTKQLNAQSACVTCSSLISNCNQCSSSSVCTACADGYKLMSDNTCSQCSITQYYNSATKTCINCPANCSFCKDDTAECNACLNNYRLDTKVCVCQSDRALKLNQCKLCSDIYANCTQCSGTACTVCAAPFILTATGCQPCKSDEIYIAKDMTCAKCTSSMKNCISCTSQTACTSCVAAPFQLSSDRSSCICPAGNYFVSALAASNSYDSCIPCNSFDKQCLQCTSLNQCSLCTDTYAFDSTLSKCRTCSNAEFQDNRPANNVQACVNCNTVHPKCTKCSNSTTCSTCIDNYDLNSSNQCQCTGNKIIVPDPTNSKQTVCKLCSDAVDVFCLTCTSINVCSQCAANYKWDATYKRCLPNIQVSIVNAKQNSNFALADTYNLSVSIPYSFQSAQLKITINFFDSLDLYNTEVSNLQAAKVANEAIPFSFQNCLIFSQDNLKTLPNPKYTRVVLADGSSILKRLDTFILHEGTVTFIYTIESQNASFLRYSGQIKISNKRQYSNIKDISFAIGKQLTSYSAFSLYQVFQQYLIQYNQVCTDDSQCNNGTCVVEDRLCKCNQNYNLFDCSDYVTLYYDQVLERIGKVLIVANPQTYQEVTVSTQLPILTTTTTIQTSQAGVIANLNAIEQIIQNEIIDNSLLEDLNNLMANVMNSVSSNIKQPNSDFTQSDIFSTINKLESITEDLLSNFDNSVDFTTGDMQLLAKISRDPTRQVYNINVKNAFDVNYETEGALFEPTTYESVGLQIKMLRFSFKINPHTLSNMNFTDQPHTYPLIIYHTYMQSSTITRLLQSNSPLNFAPTNFTFTFEVHNPTALTNLICLTLEGNNSDLESGYVWCQNMKVLASQVVCNCQNSATLFEDINYYYLPKPLEEGDTGDKAPLSMVITIIVLSVLLALLLIVQVKGKKGNRNSAKLDEAYARSKAIAIAARRRQQELEANPMNTELKEVNRHSMQESSLPTNYGGNNKSEDFRPFDSVYQHSPLFKGQNVKSIYENQESPKQDFILQEKLDFYGKGKKNDQEEEQEEDQLEEPQDQQIDSIFASQKISKFDPNLVTPAMEQQFDDNQIENKQQRQSVLKFNDEED